VEAQKSQRLSCGAQVHVVFGQSSEALAHRLDEHLQAPGTHLGCGKNAASMTFCDPVQLPPKSVLANIGAYMDLENIA